MRNNRWIIALCAVLIHISIGSVYAWSVFTKPIVEQMGWGLKDVQFTFSLAIVFLGLSAAFMGKFVEKRGPRIAGTVSAICFSTGLLLSYVAIQYKSLMGLYLAYGALGGVGLGIGYITPVSTLVKWFPDKRGLATGLAIMGFGFSAMLFGPVIRWLIENGGLANSFLYLGMLYAVIMLSAAQFLKPPSAEWMSSKVKHIKVKRDLSQMTANEAVKTIPFYLLWVMLFTNITCGIALISIASPMAQEIAGFTVTQAAVLVGFIGIFNGLGRLFWSTVSDYLGRPNTYAMFFAIQIVAFIALAHTNEAVMFQGLLYIIMTCYGGGFATIPAYLGDVFGTKQLGAIHGYILTAWSAAGIAGPMLIAWLKPNGYTTALIVFAAMFVLSLGAALIMKRYVKHKRKRVIHAVS